MRTKLLALDLDGTLLDRESRLSEENRNAVAEALAAGLEVVLVTGRSWRSTRDYYSQLGLTGPAICYLGALMVADGSGRITHHRPLAPGAWETLRAFAVAERLAVTACVAPDLAVAYGDLPHTGLLAADTAYATCAAEDFASWNAWNPYTDLNPDLSACATASPIMVAAYGARAARRVVEAFPEGLPDSQFDLTDHVAGQTVLHIWHHEVDKGRALAAYCAARGYVGAEVAAIGDAPMDISMIAYAGLGICVPGGHPDLKGQATWIASPHDAIRRILREG